MCIRVNDLEKEVEGLRHVYCFQMITASTWISLTNIDGNPVASAVASCVVYFKGYCIVEKNKSHKFVLNQNVFAFTFLLQKTPFKQDAFISGGILFEGFAALQRQWSYLFILYHHLIVLLCHLLCRNILTIYNLQPWTIKPCFSIKE